MIELKDLVVGYTKPKKAVLKVKKATAEQGQIIAVLGRNGAGKSTLLKTISGLIPSLQGDCFYNQEPLSQLPPLQKARVMAMVFGHKPSGGNLSVLDIVSLGRSPYTNAIGTLSDDDRTIIQEAIDTMSIAHLASKNFADTSDGEKQKTLVARAIAQQTPILLLDEPTSNLDLPAKMELMAAMKLWKTQEKKTIIYTTHDPSLALQIADVFWLIDGDEMNQYTVDQVKSEGLLAKVFAGKGYHFDAETGLARISV